MRRNKGLYLLVLIFTGHSKRLLAIAMIFISGFHPTYRQSSFSFGANYEQPDHAVAYTCSETDLDLAGVFTNEIRKRHRSGALLSETEPHYPY